MDSGVGDENLLENVELLMELKGYRGEELQNEEGIIDIIASKPESDERVMMRVVTKSNLGSGVVGVEGVREMESALEERGIDEAILFGKRFTSAAKSELRDEGIDFISARQKIVTRIINPQELYIKIHDMVDGICKTRCGHIPLSEEECEGYSNDPVECPFCDGSGRLKRPHRERECPSCGGKGWRDTRYTCEARLISDNADFHLEHGWITLLQNDLLSLLKILRGHREA